MALPQPLPSELVELIAHRFKVLSEPMRVSILDRMRDGERSVGELVDELGTTQQNVSKHLATLHLDGIVERRRQGNRVLYRIADEGVLQLCEHVCGGIERDLERRRRVLNGAVAETGGA
jgi:DNA-binding transcriptional ArsR family regulator